MHLRVKCAKEWNAPTNGQMNERIDGQNLEIPSGVRCLYSIWVPFKLCFHSSQQLGPISSTFVALCSTELTTALQNDKWTNNNKQHMQHLSVPYVYHPGEIHLKRQNMPPTPGKTPESAPLLSAPPTHTHM